MHARTDTQHPLISTYDPDLEDVLQSIGLLDDAAEVRGYLTTPPSPEAKAHPARTLIEAAHKDPVTVMANMIMVDAQAGRDTSHERLALIFDVRTIAKHLDEARSLAIKALAQVPSVLSRLAADETASDVAAALASETDPATRVLGSTMMGVQ